MMTSVFETIKIQNPNIPNFNFTYEEECLSTNDLAKAKSLNRPHVFFANHQTAGRGQKDNSWKDSKNNCLLMTLAWPGLNKVPPPETTLEFGKIVALCLKKSWPNLQVHIKAPNDIYLEDPTNQERKKAGGILMETVGHSNNWTLIFGFGLNVLSEPFEPSTSLSKVLSMPPSEVTFGNFLTDLISSCQNFVDQN